MSKLIIVESSGVLPVLGGISGPIKTPFKAKPDVIIRLINDGKRVYEVNPRNRTERVLLNRTNIYTTNFKNVRAAEIKGIKSNLPSRQNELIVPKSPSTLPVVLGGDKNISSQDESISEDSSSPIGGDAFESNNSFSADSDRE